MSRDDNLRQALAYARRGWPVFPIRPGAKTPAIASAHPRGDPAGGACTGQCGRDGHGFRDATTNPEKIRAWWGAHPDRNIGIATGHPGPDVVDVDQHGKQGNGFAAWNQAKRAGLVERPLAIVQTPSGGMHAYFQGTGQRSASIEKAHLDFRATGGYVVAPHSTVDGKPYLVVQRQPSTATVDFGAVRQLVAPPPQRQAWTPPARLQQGGKQNLDHLIDRMAELDDGRKRYLYWAANRILDHGQDDRLPELAAAARAAGSDPAQINRTIDSARRTERQDPHRNPAPHAQAGWSEDPGRALGRPAYQDRAGGRPGPGGRELDPPAARGAVRTADHDTPDDTHARRARGAATTAAPGRDRPRSAGTRKEAQPGPPCSPGRDSQRDPGRPGERAGQEAGSQAQPGPFAESASARSGPEREAGA